MWGRPDILWGLLALAIPIALHLLQLRRFKRVAFSNVSFLKDVKKEAQSRHRLRNLLILLTRLLAFAALILAFADPMRLPDQATATTSRQAVSIYLDTSPSMAAAGEMGALLQEAKTKATVLVDAFNETDQFHVFTSEFNGQDQRFLTQSEALERIAAVQLSTHTPPLNAVVQRSLDQFRRAGNASLKAFWISDLQKSSHDLLSVPTLDSAVSWHAIPVVGNAVPNVWIDSVWFDAPLSLKDQAAALHVRINHDALEGADGLPLKLEVDGVTESIGSFNLVPGLPTDTVLRFTHGDAGSHAVKVTLEDAPVRFDDNHYLGYQVQSAVEIFHWTSPNQPFRSASQSVDQAFESAIPLMLVERNTSLPPPQALAGFDLVVADGIDNPSQGEVALLRQFIEQGGSVFLIPDSAGIGIASLCDGLGFQKPSGWNREAGEVRQVKWRHPFFDGVFQSVPSRVNWPTYDRILRRRTSNDEETLVSAANGMPYLSRISAWQGKGALYLLGTALETGSLKRHSLFVPMLLRMAESARSTEARQLLLGKDQALTIAFRQSATNRRISETAWHIESLTNPTEKRVPEVRTTPQGTQFGWGSSLSTPGAYAVMENGERVATFGLNHDRSESLLDTWMADEWTQLVGDLGWSNLQFWSTSVEALSRQVEQQIVGERLAWYFFLAALIALAFETILLKRWNTLFS